MPVSKRNKIVALTKTSSKGRSLKSKLIETLRNAIDEYERIYLFNIGNIRSSKLRDIRFEWKESKIFMGKNTVAQIAFGRSPEEEYKDNLRHISNLLEGNVGILFTSRPHTEVIEYFNNIAEPEFAVSGHIPDETIILEPGLTSFPVSMLDQLRTWGMIVEIDDGKVMLREPLRVPTAGEPLTPAHAKILEKLGKKVATFKVDLLCKWEDGEFEAL
jgi:mRNA turnover protein 4